MTQQDPTGTIRVIVVDDDAIVRETLSSLLGSEADIDVIATATNGAEAVRLVHERTVDVVLMDIQMPVLEGDLPDSGDQRKNAGPPAHHVRR